MARYYLQEMPDMSGKGKRKVYPKIQINRQIEMEELVERIKERTSLERCMSEVNKLEPETFPRNVRLQRALAFIDKHGSISLYQYCRINRMSRSSASRELNIFCQDPESGIISNGNAPHKTWVRDRSSNG